MNEGIVHADRRYRRKILTIYIILVLLGVVLIEWGLPWAEEYLERLDPKRALRVVAVVLAVQFLIIVPIALYLFAYGRKVIKYERNPPPGIKVIWDTKVIQGRKARDQGRVMVVLSLMLIVLGLFGALYTPYLLHKLTRRKAHQQNLTLHYGRRGEPRG